MERVIRFNIDRKKKICCIMLISVLLCGMGLTGCGEKEEAGKQPQETVCFGRLELTLPEEYAASNTGGLYINKAYPDDESNIYLYEGEKKADFAQVMENGQAQFAGSLSDSYAEQYGERVQITVARYEAVEVSGVPAYVIELSYDLQGVHYEQMEYIIDAEHTYYAAFSQVGSYSWMDAFRASAGTIRIVQAEE